MNGNMLIFCLVFLPMLGAVLSYIIGKYNKNVRDVFAPAVALIEFALVLYVCLAGRTFTFEWRGFCSLGIGFVFDDFRRVYCTVIGFMWLMTLLFSKEYFTSYRNRNRYYFFNLMTLGATMGVFLSADLYTTFIFFEVMSFTSYEWVAHDEKPEAIRAANTYLAVAVIGGLVALMGLFLLHHSLGTLTISELYTAGSALTDKTILYVAGGCLLFGFGAKAGMFPLHIWLPKAHPVAPAPASALLSGILTKTGVFGILAVACNIFRYDPAWGEVVLVFGVITMVLGAVLALLSVDLKRTLACSSMSQIGFILVGVGMMGLLGEENAMAANGAILHMVNHSIFKLLLFMVAGTVYMNIHRLNLNEIRGFGRKKPFLNFAYLMGALGIGGIPLWSGYISKTLLHEGIVEYSNILTAAGKSAAGMHVVEWLFLISGGITLAYMTKLYVAVFIEKNSTRQVEYDGIKKYIHGPAKLAILLPAVVILILGILPYLTMDNIAALSAGFMQTGALEEPMHYFSLVNLKGALISLIIGALVYFLVVRKLLMVRNTQGEKVYVNRLPERLDLENMVYRPLLFGLARVLGIFAHIVSDLLDAGILALSKTVFRRKNVHPDMIMATPVTYKTGILMDAVHNVRCHDDSHAHTDQMMRTVTTMRKTTHKIMSNLSFALLMACAGLCFVIVYLLIRF
jgi:formate hydrogenlyase subunit 3/multisubunit Na+/H+ antiporter MnhD subunit